MQRKLNFNKDAIIILIETNFPRSLLFNISYRTLSYRLKLILRIYFSTLDSSYYIRSIYKDLFIKLISKRENIRRFFTRVDS